MNFHYDTEMKVATAHSKGSRNMCCSRRIVTTAMISRQRRTCSRRCTTAIACITTIALSLILAAPHFLTTIFIMIFAPHEDLYYFDVAQGFSLPLPSYNGASIPNSSNRNGGCRINTNSIAPAPFHPISSIELLPSRCTSSPKSFTRLNYYYYRDDGPYYGSGGGRRNASQQATLKDYYNILGVTQKASAPEIKSAYRRLAKIYHPDANQKKPSAKQTFQEINEAYEILSDVKKRSEYDNKLIEQRQRQQQPPRRYQEGLNDIPGTYSHGQQRAGSSTSSTYASDYGMGGNTRSGTAGAREVYTGPYGVNFGVETSFYEAPSNFGNQNHQRSASDFQAIPTTEPRSSSSAQRQYVSVNDFGTTEQRQQRRHPSQYSSPPPPSYTPVHGASSKEKAYADGMFRSGQGFTGSSTSSSSSGGFDPQNDWTTKGTGARTEVNSSSSSSWTSGGNDIDHAYDRGMFRSGQGFKGSEQKNANPTPTPSTRNRTTSQTRSSPSSSYSPPSTRSSSAGSSHPRQQQSSSRIDNEDWTTKGTGAKTTTTTSSSDSWTAGGTDIDHAYRRGMFRSGQGFNGSDGSYGSSKVPQGGDPTGATTTNTSNRSTTGTTSSSSNRSNSRKTSPSPSSPSSSQTAAPSPRTYESRRRPDTKDLFQDIFRATGTRPAPSSSSDANTDGLNDVPGTFSHGQAKWQKRTKDSPRTAENRSQKSSTSKPSWSSSSRHSSTASSSPSSSPTKNNKTNTSANQSRRKADHMFDGGSSSKKHWTAPPPSPATTAKATSEKTNVSNSYNYDYDESSPFPQYNDEQQYHDYNHYKKQKDAISIKKIKDTTNRLAKKAWIKSRDVLMRLVLPKLGRILRGSFIGNKDHDPTEVNNKFYEEEEEESWDELDNLARGPASIGSRIKQKIRIRQRISHMKHTALDFIVERRKSWKERPRMAPPRRGGGQPRHLKRQR